MMTDNIAKTRWDDLWWSNKMNDYYYFSSEIISLRKYTVVNVHILCVFRAVFIHLDIDVFVLCSQQNILKFHLPWSHGLQSSNGVGSAVVTYILCCKFDGHICVNNISQWAYKMALGDWQLSACFASVGHLLSTFILCYIQMFMPVHLFTKSLFVPPNMLFDFHLETLS